MERWVHVDLKYMPPSSSALCEDLTLWAGEGATGVVIEWENMFPYPGCSAVREDAYSPDEVSRVLAHCRDLGLTAVPLVQTLGHVEWCLSVPEYAGLREFDETPEQIRACDPAALKLVGSWVEALLDAHADSPYVHLGADEAYRLREVDRPDCSSKRDGTASVFLEHMRPLLDQVIARGKRPIIWADMVLRHPEAIEAFPREVVFCDWLYCQMTEYAGGVHGWDIGDVDAESYAALPQWARDAFTKYWSLGVDDFPKRFYQFPYTPFLRDRGFDVLAGPACLYAGNAMSGTHLPNARANERHWLGAARRFGAMGTLNTCWSCRAALRETSRTGHRAFLLQARAAESLADAELSRACWEPVAGDGAGDVAAAVDALAPPVNVLTRSTPDRFDATSRQHRLRPLDRRRADLEKAMAESPDLDGEARGMTEAVARADAACRVLEPFVGRSVEAAAWSLGARETALHAETWLAVQRRLGDGRAPAETAGLAQRIEVLAGDFLAFARGRYLDADLECVKEDRFESLLRLVSGLK